MIELKDLTIGYKDRAALVDRANARFAPSTLTALIGRNGTGKSTLLRAMAGLERPMAGEVLIEDKDIYAMSHAERARKVAYVSTTRTHVQSLNCKDAVAMGRAPYTGWTGRLSAADKHIVEESLQMTGMQDYAARNIDSLSDGEWQRIMIARALAQQTPVIMLDEPTSFLDIPNRLMLCRLLHMLAHDSNRCIIYSTHELETALRLSDEIALIDNHTLNLSEASDPALREHLNTLFDLTI